MQRQEFLNDYLHKLKLTFPSAAYSLPHLASGRVRQPAAPAFQTAPQPGSAPLAVLAGPEIQPLLLQDSREQVMLVHKSVMFFESGVNASNRADILESTLLAQMGAKAEVPDETNLTGWYKAYVEILSNIGWIVEGCDVKTFSAKAGTVEIQSVIIDILTAAFGADLVQMVRKTMESIKTLADSNGKLAAFENNTHSESNGSFQVAIVTQAGGAVSINLGTFLIVSTNKIKHILFINFSNDEAELQYASGKLTLDQTVYGNIRNLVRQKLSGRLTEFVSEIPI